MDYNYPVVDWDGVEELLAVVVVVGYEPVEVVEFQGLEYCKIVG